MLFKTLMSEPNDEGSKIQLFDKNGQVNNRLLQNWPHQKFVSKQRKLTSRKD